MAETGLKTLSLAFKEMARDDVNQLMDSLGPETPEFRTELEKNLIYVCTFGLEDPLREDIEKDIAAIRYGYKDGTE